MKRVAFISALAAAAVMAAVAASVGGAADPRPSFETLRYKIRLPLTGPPHGGPQQGNVHAFSGTLHRRGATVGAYKGACIVTEPGPAALQCNVSADISGRGEIAAVGDVGAGGVGRMVVVGGSGDFRDARGMRIVRNTRREGNALVADLTYRLKGTRR